MECRHPVIIGGKCIDCGMLIKRAESAVPAKVEEEPTNAPTPGNTAHETPKKTTRKSKG